MARRVGSPFRNADKVPMLHNLPADLVPIYVIGPIDSRRPVAIGYDRNVRHSVTRLQRASNDKVGLLHTVYAVGKLAGRVKNRSHKILQKAGKILDDEWFDIDAEWAKKVIAVAAHEEKVPIYPISGINFVTREEMAMRQFAKYLDELGVNLKNLGQGNKKL